MQLNLKKPLVVFDLETTGINVTQDRIIEISYIKVWPDGKEESKSMRINPGRHIPEQSTQIHGITDEDVKDCPSFKEVAADLARTFENCDFAGFNSNHFDVPMLMEEMLRAGLEFDISKDKLVDVQNIFHKMEQRTLIAAYKFYCKKDLINAHSSLADATATYEVLKAQLDRYQDTLENNVDFLSEFSKVGRNVDLAGRMVYNEQEEIVFNFGKYKGRSVKETLHRDPGYYSWIQQGDFPRDTKNILTRIKLSEAMIYNNTSKKG